MAYLIGEWEFYGLPLDISRDVLIPRPDTEVLAEQAIGYIKTLGECRVLDLCAGSGCIGLAVAAQAPQARVVLGEWSDGALQHLPPEHPPQRPHRPGGAHGRRTPGRSRRNPWESSSASSPIPPYIPRADIDDAGHLRQGL